MGSRDRAPRVLSTWGSGLPADSGSAAADERPRCCVCGRSTAGAPDYLTVTVSDPCTGDTRELGAHAGCGHSLLHPDFRVDAGG